MNIRYVSCLVYACLGSLMLENAMAADAPFAWPDKYKITYTNTKDGQQSSLDYQVDGKLARMQHCKRKEKSDEDRCSILFFDLNKMQVTVVMLLPSNKSTSPPIPYKESKVPALLFPNGGTWEKVTDTTIGQKKAEEYKVTTSWGPVRVWLEAKRHTPLKVIDAKGNVSEIGQYLPGKVDKDAFILPKADDIPLDSYTKP